MSGANTFGHLFRLTSFGESHGEALGAVIDGCPAGVVFQEDILRDFLERRRPGHDAAVSARKEEDQFDILSGLFEGRTLGTPIAIMVRNQDARSRDYSEIRSAPRAGHGDDVWRDKFGHSDHRGGGRSSGRETLARVIGGAFAKMFLVGVDVIAFPRKIGPIEIDDQNIQRGGRYNLSPDKVQEIAKFLTAAKTEGQSYGGLVEVRVNHPPKSLGQPVFHKLKADLAAAMMSIGATSGFELGTGFAAADACGTDFHINGDPSKKQSIANGYGGIRGGISTGETICFRVAFKPTSSILDVAKKGRHDPCIVLRALPVVEAMTWLVLADHELWRRLDRI